MRAKFGGLPLSKLNHLPEEVIGQKADAIGKEAEEQAHEEVGGTLRVNSSGHQVGSELRELGRHLLGDTGAGGLRAEQGRLGEHGPENFQRRQRAVCRGRAREKIVKREAVDQRTSAR